MFIQVEWVEREPELMHHNRFAKGVCQSGMAYNNYLYSAPGNNLTGLGEILGIADTGIDFTNCYFNDPAHPAPYNTLNLAHRKVRVLLTDLSLLYIHYSMCCGLRVASTSTSCSSVSRFSSLFVSCCEMR